MTEQDLKSKIADIKAQMTGMQASLSHIERQMADAAKNRDKLLDQHGIMLERVVKLEAAAQSSLDLSPRVSHVEMENAVFHGERDKSADVIKEVRKWLFGGVAAMAAIVGMGLMLVGG